MSKELLAIVRGERIVNQSARGNPSYARLRGLMNYIAYGRYQDQPTFARKSPAAQAEVRPRGLWLDHNGKAVAHEDALRWARDKVHRYGYDYSYQLLLSTRHGGLTAADFNQVLRQGSELSDAREWRLMLHEDTGNQHAHAVLLRREKLSAAGYKEWQQAMQTELERLQAERHEERQLQLETAVAPERRRGQELTL
jgi:hypothetical protein